MVEIFRVGEIVYCSNVTHSIGGQPNVNGLGQILDIVDRFTGESYQELEVIRCNGDKNTKVHILVNVLTEKIDNLWDLSCDFTMRKAPVKSLYDPHSITKHIFEHTELLYKKALNNMNKRMEFIKEYSMTRDDKIAKILD